MIMDMRIKAIKEHNCEKTKTDAKKQMLLLIQNRMLQDKHRLLQLGGQKPEEMVPMSELDETKKKMKKLQA